MKKIYVLIILIILVSGCSPKKINNENVNSSLSSYNLLIDIIDYLDGLDSKLVGTNEVNLYLFYSSTCPHCHAEIDWLDDIKDEYPYLNVIKYEASDNFEFYEATVEQMKINDYHVPLTIIGSDFYVGFSEYKKDDIIKLIEKYSKYKHCDMVNIIKEGNDITKCNSINKNQG